MFSFSSEAIGLSMPPDNIFEDYLEPYIFDTIIFPLSLFLDFLGINNINQYQKNKYNTFIKVLPFATNVLQSLDDQQYISLVVFPTAKVGNIQQRLQVCLSVNHYFRSSGHFFNKLLREKLVRPQIYVST